MLKNSSRFRRRILKLTFWPVVVCRLTDTKAVNCIMKFLAAVLFFIIFSCSSTPENKAETNTGNAEKQDTNRVSIPQLIPGQEISFDVNILYNAKTNDTFYLGADKIDFLMGDEAFEAAKKNGDLDTGYNQDGTI